jgi:hypothetical protein
MDDEESKTGAGVGVVALSSPQTPDGFVAQQDMSQVIRTVEVEISYEKNETPMIHACLVGLVQGQAMERLAGRWSHGLALIISFVDHFLMFYERRKSLPDLHNRDIVVIMNDQCML